uniref:Uncharacterized protein n=1 Tax=Lepeophtheirus salmonis TaxID=72036 RepID=A0A0K2TNS3_LEPSM
MTDTAGLPLDMQPKGIVVEVGKRAVGSKSVKQEFKRTQKTHLKRVLQRRR